jgi:hypothetical protein
MSVRRRRFKLGILRPDPTHRPWTKQEDALLGTMTDAALLKRLHRTENGIQLRRTRRKIAKFDRVRRRWTAEDERLLGRMSDAKIAKRLECTIQAVSMRRYHLGIPPFANSASNSFSERPKFGALTGRLSSCLRNRPDKSPRTHLHGGALNGHS